MGIIAGTDKTAAGAKITEYVADKTALAQPLDAPAITSILGHGRAPVETLLSAAETAAARNETAKRKWQLLSLMSLMLIVPASAAIVWLYTEFSDLAADHARLRLASSNLAEQLDLTKAGADELTTQLVASQNQASRLAVENAGLRAENSALAVKAEAVVKAVQNSLAQRTNPDQPGKPITFDENRLQAIKAGRYPADMSRGELIAALGQPDRIFKSATYEQLLYFDRTPGRFWFSNGPFLQITR